MTCCICGYVPQQLEPVEGVTATAKLPAQWKCSGCGNWNEYDATERREVKGATK